MGPLESSSRQGRLNGSPHQFLLSSYTQLRRVAGAIVKHERSKGAMQPTGLVHDALVRILQRSSSTYNNREHFFRTMIREMRCVIIDSARRSQSAQKYIREAQHMSFLVTDDTVEPAEAIALDEALEELAKIDPEKAIVAQLRLLVGLSHAEIAASLGIPQRTVERRWAFARSRLALLLDLSA